MWGQGLEDPDKMHNVLSKMLQDRFSDRKVNVIFLAHSGSSTGYKLDGSIDGHHEPRIHGEVPTFYPTIVQQIEAFDDQAVGRDSVDLILLDAGVNDVHVTRILDPLTRPQQIEKLVEIYCHQHMVMLLQQLTTNFKNARIVIIGYYQMLTEASEEGYIHALLKAFGKVPVNLIADVIVGAFRHLLKRRVLANCETFATQSLVAFGQSAEEVNGYLAAKRVFVVPSAIEAQHAALASDPWLFGINDDLSPQDPVASLRAEECRCAGPHRTERLVCDHASAGHPNPEGAKAYADAILATILENDLCSA